MNIQVKQLKLDRQTFLGLESAEKLDRTRVAIVGLGGGGSHVHQQLAHLGVGDFILFDPDKVEDTNLNRLVGATQADAAVGTSKATIGERIIKGINEAARIRSFHSQWQRYPAEIRSRDVIFGCVDSIAERDQLEKAARRYLIPYIDIGMDVYAIQDEFLIAGQVAISMPDDVCLRCLGIITDQALRAEAQRYGATGNRPQVVWPNGLLASAAVGMFVKMTTPWEKQPKFPTLIEYDGNAQTLLPSNKLRYIEKTQCSHFVQLDDVGDPFWTIQS